MWGEKANGEWTLTVGNVGCAGGSPRRRPVLLFSMNRTTGAMGCGVVPPGEVYC
uniref:P/Homo B domain-containing protein n=1 Tax=Romanomermis culicivorax TaxID=13658 RepID=A0A915JVZ7_ROMCU